MLPISNVSRVTILSQLRGLGSVNTSQLGIITDEAPIPADFGIFRGYKDPSGVGADFGTNSDTYGLALVAFSQQPNILTGNGTLLVVPREQAAPASAAKLQSSLTINFLELTATDYYINLTIDAGAPADLLIGTIDTTSLATIESSLNSTAVAAAGATFTVSGEISKATLTLESDTTGATSLITIGASVATGTNISPLLGLSGTANGAATGVETIKDCIFRTEKLVPYFGLIYNEKMSDANLTEVAQLVQALDILQFVGSNLSADIAGIFTTLVGSGYTQTRMLYYSNSEAEALDFAAGYASRGLSVNFSGTNTMITMNLKEVVGVPADPVFSTSVGQTRYDACKAAGVDCYADYGVPGVLSTEPNKYFDEIYIELAFKLDLQITAFNFLKQNPTKTPQTETGVAGLKSASRKVCNRYVTNGSFAPGVWNQAIFFGNPEDHLRNVAEFGFWIYSLPVANQSASDRAARLAPVIQIAVKLSGAIQGVDQIVFIDR